MCNGAAHVVQDTFEVDQGKVLCRRIGNRLVGIKMGSAAGTSAVPPHKILEVTDGRDPKFKRHLNRT
jgi:hypothetical protein